MKITVFTGNQPRHLNLINCLASISDECFAIQETNTVFPGLVSDFFAKSDTFQEYFSNVTRSEKSIFGDVSFLSNVKTLVIKGGDLNHLAPEVLRPALESDVFVVFGASYIKGWLIDELVARNAINIHMGISPYYRGSSCNFWSVYDSNPHLMGATVHRLSKGLDSGKMMYHVAPVTTGCSTPFDFTMQSVRSAHDSLVQRISNGSIFEFEQIEQDRNLEVRYTRNKDFTDDIAREFLDRNLTIDQIQALIEEKKGEVELLSPFYPD
jgi:hypothetical protein